MRESIIKKEKVHDIFFDKKYAQITRGRPGAEPAATVPVPQKEGQPMQQTLPQQQMQQTVPSGVVPVGVAPLPNIVDRTFEIRQMIDNYQKLEKLAKSNASMWQQVLDSMGENTSGFLEDPSTWNDKKWSEEVRRTERLLRDANQALPKLLDEMEEGEEERRLPGELEEGEMPLKEEKEVEEREEKE